MNVLRAFSHSAVAFIWLTVFLFWQNYFLQTTNYAWFFSQSENDNAEAKWARKITNNQLKRTVSDVSVLMLWGQSNKIGWILLSNFVHFEIVDQTNWSLANSEALMMLTNRLFSTENEGRTNKNKISENRRVWRRDILRWDFNTFFHCIVVMLFVQLNNKQELTLTKKSPNRLRLCVTVFVAKRGKNNRQTTASFYVRRSRQQGSKRTILPLSRTVYFWSLNSALRERFRAVRTNNIAKKIRTFKLRVAIENLHNFSAAFFEFRKYFQWKKWKMCDLWTIKRTCERWTCEYSEKRENFIEKKTVCGEAIKWTLNHCRLQWIIIRNEMHWIFLRNFLNNQPATATISKAFDTWIETFVMQNNLKKWWKNLKSTMATAV